MASRNRRAITEERLSPAEWQLMRICWRLGRCTVREVLREDLKTRIRDYRTILTFMTRMTKKGWLEVEKEGKTNFYRPIVQGSKAIEEEIFRFLDDVIGTDPENLELLKRVLGEGG